MSIKSYLTDSDLEVAGAWVYFKEFRVKVARAHKGNAKYFAELMKYGRRYRDADVPDEVLMDLCVKTLIMDWETDVNGNGKYTRGIEDVASDSNKLLPPTPENLIKVLKHVPEVVKEIFEQANKRELYLKESLEKESGNS